MPAAGILEIRIAKAKLNDYDFRESDNPLAGGGTDAFVVVLYMGSTCTTPTITNNSNPVWHSRCEAHYDANTTVCLPGMRYTSIMW